MGRTLALRGVLWGAGGLSGSSDDDPVGSGASDDDPGSLGGLEGFRDRSERNPSVPSGIRGSWACSEGPTTIRRTKTNDPARSDEKRKKTTSWGA
ncbi:hypothetical protein PGTUg99_035184 [Puccinia graminis f. sp. tritici]|uniref:Uncharacterized protein n=1 Tax=Puccinia graminis f. sp. tritici TaxID=56615 RepID=A0A5B0MJT5_PUCGR|nr:hypothetical protein PGTUg99_035184 [Puccinia graminis f. sp. tritici]